MPRRSSSHIPALFGLTGVVLVVEYAALGLAYDFDPIRRFALIGQLGELTKAAMSVAIVAIAVVGLLLVTGGTNLRHDWLLLHLARVKARIWLHAVAYASLILVSHIWFRDGASPTVSPGSGLLWLGLAAITGISGLAMAVPSGLQLGLRSSLTLAAGAVVLGLLTLGIALAAEVSWSPLQEITLSVVVRLSSWVYDDVVFDPETAIVGTERFLVQVAPLCSGLEGIGLMLVLLPAFIWINRESFRLPRAFLLVALGVVAIWLANCVRIFSLIVLGSEVSPELAVGAFHSHVGWFFFSLIVVALAAYAIRSPWWSRREPTRQDTSNPAAPFVAPLVVWVAAGMVTGAFAQGPDPYYGVRAVPVLAVLWFFRKDYCELVRGLSLRRATLWGLVSLAVWLTLSVPETLPRWAYLSGHVGTPSLAPEMTGIGGVAWIATRAVLSSTLVPVVEELAFRGYLLRRLVRREFEEVPFTRVSPLALVVSSLLFGLLHDAWIAGTAVGVLFVWVQSRTGSLANAVVAHAVANSGVAVYVLVSGDWSQWL